MEHTERPSKAENDQHVLKVLLIVAGGALVLAVALYLVGHCIHRKCEEEKWLGSPCEKAPGVDCDLG